MRTLNKYLLRNYPFVWQSKIHYVFIISLIMMILGYMLHDDLRNNPKVEDLDITFLILSLFLFCIFWLYSQYLTDSILNKFTLSEYAKMISLYTLSFFIFATPLVLFEITFLTSGIYADTITFLLLGLCLPSIFLSTIIRFYNFSEIILLILITICYVISGTYIVGVVLDIPEDGVVKFFIISFFVFLIYVIRNLMRKSYRKLDRARQSKHQQK